MNPTDLFKMKSHKEFTELLTDRDNLAVSLKAVTDELSALKASQINFDEIKAQLLDETKKLTDSETKLAEANKEIANLKAEVEKEKSSAEVKAQKLVASKGIPLEELSQIKETISETESLDAIRSEIKDLRSAGKNTEATALYKKHRMAFLHQKTNH
jgi:hypothetical protein